MRVTHCGVYTKSANLLRSSKNGHIMSIPKAMYGEVRCSSWSALQSRDFWYVLVNIWDSAVNTTAQTANRRPTRFKLRSYTVA